jgi:hypothetical protein
MGVSFSCDVCGTVGTSLNDWYSVTVTFYWDDPSKPDPPGGKTYIGEVTKVFDRVECRDTWTAQAEMTAPPMPVSAAFPGPVATPTGGSDESR